MSFANLFPLLGQATAAPAPIAFHQEAWFRFVAALLIIGVSWAVGKWLSKTWRMPDYSFRFGVILFSLIAGVVICAWRWPPKLGIDLKGGVILIYEVVEDQEETLSLDGPLDRIRNYLEDRIEADTEATLRGGNQIVVTTPSDDEETLDEIEATVEGIEFANLELSALRRDQEDGGTAIVFNAASGEEAGAVNMDEMIRALNTRINPGGQKEVIVRKFGEQQVEIIIPEVDSHEIELIKDKISTAGLLEFRIIANLVRDKDAIDLAEKSPAKQVFDGDQLVAKWVLLDTEQVQSTEGLETRVNQADEVEVLVRIDEYNVTGGYLDRAASGYDEIGQPAVNFTFDSEGAVLFGQLTEENVPDASTGFKQQLAIILDGRLFSAAGLEEVITSQGQIHGSFTQEKVQFLVDILNAGSLPAALDKTPVSETSISPQLGADTIRNGSITMIVSTIMILMFMLAYYRFSGIVADVAVMMNLILVAALMITLNAAFTLAGLAGLVLSVGMAVDANVLIYERMREELQRGAALRMAIRNGFSRAMSTIVDSNLTTLLTGVVLYAIGTDQLKGFAITLILGLLLNLYTAVYVARTIFDVAERRRWISELKMMKMFDAPSFDFVRPTKYAIGFSLLIVIGGMVAAVSRGEGLFGIDFTGGSSVQIVLDENHALTVAEVRQIVDPSDESQPRLEDVTVSTVGTPDAEGKSRYYKVDTSLANIEDVEELLQKMFGDKLEVYEMNYSRPEASAGSVATGVSAEKTDAKASANEGAKIPPAKTEVKGTKVNEEAKEPAVKPEAENDKVEEKSAEETDEPAKDETKEKSEPKEPQASAARLTRPWLALAATQAIALLQDEAQDSATKKGDAPAKANAAKSDSSDKEEPVSDAEDAKAERGKQTPSDDKEDQDAPAEKQSSALPAKGAVETSKTPSDATLPSAFAPVAERPDTAQAAFAGGSVTTLTFKEGINRDALLARLEAAADQLKLQPAQFLLEEVKSTQDELNTRLFGSWKINTTLPPERVELVLTHVQSELAETPVFRGANTIGGKVAGHARIMAIYAVLASMVMIVIYVWVRFQNIVFGLAAVVALVHDVLVTVAALAVSYYIAPFLGWAMVDPFKISLDVVAALLTIVGFSINDTIVIFDRIREIKGKSPEITKDMINKAVNQTLGRTILTSGTVLIVTIILYIWGGQEIHPFAFAMLIGIVSGTYSTVWIAAPLVLWLRKPTTTRPVSRRGTEVAMRA
ncbi:MAG: protein translocase subunit SecD [Pirellulales bacterium]